MCRGEIPLRQAVQPNVPRFAAHGWDPHRPAGGDGLGEGSRLEFLFGGEVGVEGAVRESGVGHHGGDRRSTQPLLTNPPGGGIQHSAKGLTFELITLHRGCSHDSHHITGMMTVMRISVWMSKTVTTLCVPITSSTSCDQPIFVDHATDVSTAWVGGYDVAREPEHPG